MARYRLTMESERTNETTQHVFKNKDELIEHLLDFIDMVAYYNPYLEVEYYGTIQMLPVLAMDR